MPKYRITINLMVDLDLEGDESKASRQAEEITSRAFVGEEVYKMQVKVSKLKERRKTVRLAEVPIEAVLAHIRCDDSKKEYQIGGKLYKVRMNSQRYFIFRESAHCAACRLEGTVMVLEQNAHDKSPHFNLYAIEGGRYVLMTKDHVLPKAFGGEDRHSNYQTMCSICNGLKGSENISLEGIRELRRVYNETRSEPRKKVMELLAGVRAKFATSRSEPKIPRCYRKRYYARRKALEPHLLTNIDLNIWRLPCGTLVGRSVYESPPPEGIQVACIREGTPVHPVGDDGAGRVAISLSEEQQFFVSQGYIDYRDSRPC